MTKKKKKNARMMDTDLVTYATSSNYDPVEDVVLTEDVRVDKHVDYGRVMKTKNRVSVNPVIFFEASWVIFSRMKISKE